MPDLLDEIQTWYTIRRKLEPVRKGWRWMPFANKLNQGKAIRPAIPSESKSPIVKYQDLGRLHTPEYFNFATDVVDRWAEDPDKTALHWIDAAGKSERRLSFSDIKQQSTAFAASLYDAGMKAGDRMMVVIGRDPAWWVGMIGLIRAGIVAVPGPTLLTPNDYLYRIQEGGISGLLVEHSQVDKVEQIRSSCPRLKILIVSGTEQPGWQSLESLSTSSAPFTPVPTRSSDTCLVYFTSGTTGPAKMVRHTHASYPLGHQVTGRDWLGLEPDDLHWNLSDTGWAKASWSSLFGPWHQGATVFVQEAPRKFDAQSTFDILTSFPITTFCAPPTVYLQLVALDLRSRPLASLRDAVAAGEPLNPEVIDEWRKATGITIRDGYGQTETTILVGNFPDKKVKPGSMGLPAPGMEVDVIDENLQPLPPDREGDIAIRISPERPLGLFVEYERNKEENRLKFRGRYYLTGDRATRDKEGYFWFVGRSDDVILSAGYRIGPFEVESALVEHPAVLEAAVVAAPDSMRYQIVNAYVILHKGRKGDKTLVRELQDHVKQVTAPYKYPREIEFTDTLPKTISGKIRRVELRERETKRYRCRLPVNS